MHTSITANIGPRGVTRVTWTHGIMRTPARTPVRRRVGGGFTAVVATAATTGLSARRACLSPGKSLLQIAQAPTARSYRADGQCVSRVHIYVHARVRSRTPVTYTARTCAAGA